MRRRGVRRSGPVLMVVLVVVGLSACAASPRDTGDPAVLPAATDEAADPSTGSEFAADAATGRMNESVWAYYGNPWSPMHLANLRLADGSRFSYRFSSKYSGLMESFQPYFQYETSRSGYASGTGGIIQMTLVHDDGAGMPAESEPIARTTFEPMLSNGRAFPEGANSHEGHHIAFATHHWEESPAIEAGQRYHIIFENIDPDDDTNYVSINNAYSDDGVSVRGPLAPSVDDWGLTVDWGEGASWAEFTNREGDGIGRYDITMNIYMADGRGFGNAYMSFVAEDFEIDGRVRLRQVFDPAETHETSALSVYVRGTGTLQVGLVENGQQVRRWELPVDTEGFAHHVISVEPVVLISGRSYALEFSSLSGTLAMGTFRDGSVGLGENFRTGGSWDDGYAEVDSGAGWEEVLFTYADVKGVAFLVAPDPNTSP